MSTKFDYLKSKIQELHIPLPNFKYFHKPSSEEDVFENYIGREEISEQLEEWLTSGDSGSYLVTGYRGMGKSSFVGKVLNKIARKSKKNRKIQLFTVCCTVFITSIVLSFFAICNNIILFRGYTFGCPNTLNEFLRSLFLVLFLLSGFFIICRLWVS